MTQTSWITSSKIFLSLVLYVQSEALAASLCRCFPGDVCWPALQDWESLNSSINGQLVATDQLLGSPCHDPTYDVGKCQAVQQNWLNASEQ